MSYIDDMNLEEIKDMLKMLLRLVNNADESKFFNESKFLMIENRLSKLENKIDINKEEPESFVEKKCSSHIYDAIMYLTYPPQFKCKKCGYFHR